MKSSRMNALQASGRPPALFLRQKVILPAHDPRGLHGRRQFRCSQEARDASRQPRAVGGCGLNARPLAARESAEAGELGLLQYGSARSQKMTVAASTGGRFALSSGSVSLRLPRTSSRTIGRSYVVAVDAMWTAGLLLTLAGWWRAVRRREPLAQHFLARPNARSCRGFN